MLIKNKSVLVIGMGPINEKDLEQIKNIKFDICYACGRCISSTKYLNITKRILSIPEGRIAGENFWIKADKKRGEFQGYGRLSNEINFNLADECIIFTTKNAFNSSEKLRNAVREKMPKLKVSYKRYISFFFESFRLLGLFDFLYVLGLKGFLLALPSFLLNRQIRKWGYQGPSSGFKTIIKALNVSNKVTIIGFTLKDRLHAQVENKVINYPKSSIKYHLVDDKKIYKVLKNKINFLGN
tara:strand:- start:25 stop:744 length:720 start_codon:yes stop_codon:yes gene_type:complete